ncbi:MAG: protein kinase [Planctomycetes bacterium]|nr:protein kinase [Planctomycetota bacterium]
MKEKINPSEMPPIELTKEQIDKAEKEITSGLPRTYLGSSGQKSGQDIVDNISHALKEEEVLTKESLAPELGRKYKENGAIADRYIKLEKIGSGGNGVVFKAYDIMLKRNVAVKILDTISDQATERFVREAEIIAKLEHTNIVPIYELGIDSGKHFIAMQFIEGTTLNNLIGNLTIEQTLDVMLQVCDAIEFGHSLGVIHRDIKPHNVMIDKNGRVFVLDYGIARFTNSFLTNTMDILGTPHYISPEQIEGITVDNRSDIYSIGATLYHCVTGKTPFKGETPLEIVKNVVEKEVVPPRHLNEKIHKDLEVIVQKCLFKDKFMRYQTVHELKDEIERFKKGDPILARNPSIKYILFKKLRKYRAFFIVSFLSMLVFLPIIIPIINQAIKEGIFRVQSARQKATRYYEIGNSLLNRVKLTRWKEDRKQLGTHINSAIVEFSRALDIDPTFSDAYLKRGEIYFRGGSFEDALNDFTSAVNNSNAMSEAYFMRVLSRFMTIATGRYNTRKERQQLESAMKEDVAHLTGLNSFPAYIRCSEAIIYCTENVFGKSNVADDKVKKAQELFDEVIKLDPTLTSAHLMKALVSSRSILSLPQKKGNVTKELINDAIFYLETCINIEPNNPIAYLMSSVFYALAGSINKMNDCIQTIEDIIVLIDPLMIVGFVRIHLVFGSKEAAMKLAKLTYKVEQKIKDESLSRKFHMYRGYDLLQLEKHEKAEKDFAEVLKRSVSPELRNFATTTINSFKEKHKSECTLDNSDDF